MTFLLHQQDSTDRIQRPRLLVDRDESKPAGELTPKSSTETLEDLPITLQEPNSPVETLLMHESPSMRMSLSRIKQVNQMLQQAAQQVPVKQNPQG